MEVPRFCAEPSHRHPYHRYGGINGDSIRPSYSAGGPSSSLSSPPPLLDTTTTRSRFDSCPHLPPRRRSQSSSTRTNMHTHTHMRKDRTRDKDEKSWTQTAYTYAWVLDQEIAIAEMSHQNEETVQWVHEQRKQEQYERDMLWKRMIRGKGLQRFMSSSSADTSNAEATAKPSWRHHGAEILSALRWARDVEMMMEEELLRLQASRREAERCRLAFEKRRAQEEARAACLQREQQQQQQRMRALRDERYRAAWSAYEERWAELTANDSSSSSPLSFDLTFDSIPWPLFSSPGSVADITPEDITAFILSPLHSIAQSRKDRIKMALRRWHPDRFGRLLARVLEVDKEKVEEAVGIIARCLNHLLEREN